MTFNEAGDGILDGGGSADGGNGAGDAGSNSAGDSGVPGGAAGGEGIPVMPEWLSGVDSQSAGDPSMSNIKDLDGLVKSYIHAQKMVGSDKMLVPNQNSAPEEWRDALHKLGLPAEKAGYEFKRGEDSKLAENFHNGLVEKAYELGILPNQMQGILDHYEGAIGEAETQHVENMNSTAANQLQALKDEWGEGFHRKAAAANVAIDSFGGDELRAHIKNLGLTNDATMIKMFSNIGEQMKEDDFAPSDTAGFGNTPDQAQVKMNTMLADTNHPLNNPQHANFKAAQAEYNKLAQQATPKGKQK